MSIRTPSLERLTRADANRTPRSKFSFGRSIALATAIAAAGISCKENPRDIQFPDAATSPDATQVFPDAAPPPPPADAGFADVGFPDAGFVDTGTSPMADAGPPPPPDRDRDGVPDDRDNCGDVANSDQHDTDLDTAGDLCDLCPGVQVAGGRHGNVDGDRFGDDCDGCPITSDDGQDGDRDGVPNACDNAPQNYNPNQTDADLDGIADVIDNCRRPNPGQVDNDVDGHGVPCDCNDNSPSIHPGAADSPCDRVDSDCDGIGAGVTSANSTVIISGEPLCECTPGTTRQTGSSVGECRPDNERCFAFSSGDEGSVITAFDVTTVGRGPTAEVCDSNVPAHDEDCDGSANEQGGPNGGPCECVPGQTQACGIATAPCSQGVQRCVQVAGQNVHRWGACEGAVGPAGAVDLCNGANDDCQGGVDDGFGVGNPCTGTGLCGTQQGRLECASLTTTGCSTNPGGSQSLAREEVCDAAGIDEDCTGGSNDAVWQIIEADRVGRAQGRVGEPCTHTPAGPGTLQCAGLRAVECSSVSGRSHAPLIPEGSVAGECDGRDNDFDGSIDEGCQCSPGQSSACGTNEGACNQGGLACVGGTFATTCGGPNFVGPTAERYNGVDDNCNTVVDDGPDGIPGSRCRGSGPCGEGVREVANATTLVCSTMPGGSDNRATAERINGIDDDCDGQIDDPPTGGTWPGTGLALGASCSVQGICGSGVVVGDGPGATTTICSSESRHTHHPALPETTIAGQCGDGLDNDCDGTTDDGCQCVPGETRACGTRMCMNGTQTCDSLGRWGQNCAGATVPSRELCGDGIDSDCDGNDNNGYTLRTGTSTVGSCRGIGACGGTPMMPVTGGFECAAVGSTTTRCSTNPGGTQDRSRPERCDGVDNDCDGRTDEDFDIGSICAVPRRCGPLNGERTCLDAVNTQCVTNSSTVAEILGNGIDEDCDGDLTR